jgi:hypothetical protein
LSKRRILEPTNIMCSSVLVHQKHMASSFKEEMIMHALSRVFKDGDEVGVDGIPWVVIGDSMGASESRTL